MALEELEEEFMYGNLDDDEIGELVEEEVEDMLDEDFTRQEILDEVEDMDEEFQDLVIQILDYEVMAYYSDQLDQDRGFEDQFSETLENLRKDYSREKVIEMASEQSEEFEEKVRDELE